VANFDGGVAAADTDLSAGGGERSPALASNADVAVLPPEPAYQDPSYSQFRYESAVSQGIYMTKVSQNLPSPRHDEPRVIPP
jgi:hypothetical protein